MNLTRIFFEENLIGLNPEVLKAVIQLLYEREWIARKKISRREIAQRFSLSEYYSQVVSLILQQFAVHFGARCFQG